MLIIAFLWYLISSDFTYYQEDFKLKILGQEQVYLDDRYSLDILPTPCLMRDEYIL